MDNLRCCPFCGGEGVREHNEAIAWEHSIVCDRCHVDMAFSEKSEVTAAWNRRVDVDAQIENKCGMNVNGWIKTSDRLPEDGEMVLAWNANRFGVDRYVFAEFDSEMGFIYSNLVIATNVTHWQLLPKPPTGEPHDDQV